MCCRYLHIFNYWLLLLLLTGCTPASPSPVSSGALVVATSIPNKLTPLPSAKPTATPSMSTPTFIPTYTNTPNTSIGQSLDTPTPTPPPTSTPVPPTDTPVAPTNTPTPINTTIPPTEAPGPPTYTPITLTPTSTSTPSPAPTCPYQGETDEETIANLIQAEATAANTKNMFIIQNIFSPEAVFYDRAPTPPEFWNSPLARYREDLFKSTEFRQVKHFDILPVGLDISGDTAWYTSGSQGCYKKGGGPWTAMYNGSSKSGSIPGSSLFCGDNSQKDAEEFGSEHWILKKNNASCWVITQMDFNAGHVPFP